MKQTFFANIENTITSGEDVLISGLSGSARTFFLHELVSMHRGKLLCIVPSEEVAYDLARELTALLGENRVFLFLARDFIFMKENTSSMMCSVY